MIDRVKRWLLGVLRVPPEAHPPEGGRVIRVFRAAPNFLWMKLAVWAARQGGAVLGLVGGLLVLDRVLEAVEHPLVGYALLAGEAFAWTVFLLQLPFSLAVLWLDFEMRWYILSDRSLRIREGILTVREKTLTFANIQQITIRQNPLQRLLGIADVQVSTAGGGSGAARDGAAGETMHEAFFRGVDNAPEIRTAIKERVQLHRDAGLGDPDEAHGPQLAPVAVPGLPAGEVLDAARELRQEVRELRRALVPA